jgi:hypothetical protein
VCVCVCVCECECVCVYVCVCMCVCCSKHLGLDGLSIHIIVNENGRCTKPEMCLAMWL